VEIFRQGQLFLRNGNTPGFYRCTGGGHRWTQPGDLPLGATGTATDAIR